MTAATAFDGSAYRRTVLTPLRAGAPARVEDLFWLGAVPRALDDAAAIAERLREAKAFLHKERARPRQADVAAAVLREWPRIEGVLLDGAARRALRGRLGDAPPGPGSGASASAAERATPAAGGAEGNANGPGDAARATAPRRRQQVEAALSELARLRGEPELGEDLFAFLGLPLAASPSMVAARAGQIGEANRRRRADRERSLTDELLIHARELLVDGDPAVYRRWLSGEPEPAAEPVTPDPEVTPRAEQAATQPEAERVVEAPPRRTRGLRPPAAQRPASTSAPAPAAAPEPEPEPDPAASAVVPPAIAPLVTGVAARREADGALVVTWTWPFGLTEVFVSVGEASGPGAPGPGGRKLTNAKYELDGGARLEGVATGTTVRIHSGRRDGAGALAWNAPGHARGTMAP